MNTLKTKLLTGVAALALISGPALAADVAVGTDAAATATVGSDTAATADANVKAGTDAAGTTTAAEGTMSTDMKKTDGATTADSTVMDKTKEMATDAKNTMTAAAESAGDTITKWGEKADAEISSLFGTNVYSAEGNDVGEIDNFAEVNGELVAIVGIGGFLGMGEHDVAIPVSKLMVSGDDQVTIEGYTEEELKAMPEYDETTAVMIDGDTTLRAAMSV